MSKPLQKSLKTGEFLFREADESNSLYLVLHGRISIRKPTGRGPIELGQVGQNQFVGELAFFDRKPRSADAVAISPTEVVEIPYVALDPIFNPAPDYLKKMMISLAARLRDADECIRDLKERLGLRADPVGSAQNGESEIARVLAMTLPSDSSEKK
jgi:CRP/FNR family transcriptional regulator, cyclic AMP receptor protein